MWARAILSEMEQLILTVCERKEDVTTASICILITDILCTVARNAQSESFYEGRERWFSTSHTKSAEEYLQKGTLNSFRENLKRKYNAKDWALQRLRRLVLCQQPSSKLCKFTNELHSQLMEAMSMHQAAAKQFKSTTGNMLIAVHFVICFICSTVFLLNCFLIAYLLNRASQLYFPGHQLKGLTRVGSLILPSETGLGMIAELHLSCPASNYIWRSFWLPEVF